MYFVTLDRLSKVQYLSRGLELWKETNRQLKNRQESTGSTDDDGKKNNDSQI